VSRPSPPNVSNATNVLALARYAPGMVAFFTLLGRAIQGHRSSRRAYQMLLAVGLTAERAWSLMEGWEHFNENEKVTGWTAEVTAMAFVIIDVEDWKHVQWSMLTKQLVAGADRPVPPRPP